MLPPFQICDMLLPFEIRAPQMRLGPKIEANFALFDHRKIKAGVSEITDRLLTERIC